MKSIRFNLFPGLKRRAVTFSYDDGREFDVRLAEISIVSEQGARLILTPPI